MKVRTPRFSIDKEGFQSGISDVSIGRFGGFRDEWPEAVHCLTYSAQNLSMLAGRQRLFFIPLPGEYKISKKADWTIFQTRADYRTNKPQTVTATSSLLAPAMHFNFTDNHFCLRLNYGLVAEHAAFPAKSGIKIRSPLEKYDGQGVIYDRKSHGSLMEPWMLVWFGTNPWSKFECPLLLVFENQPEKIFTHGSGGVIDAQFSGHAGNLAVMPVAGIKRWKEGETSSWRSKGVPRDIIDVCRYWAEMLQQYPVSCEESFKINTKKNRVVIKNKFSYLINKGDWKVSEKPFSPVSPMLARVHSSGYPVTLSSPLIKTNLPTNFGNYTYIKGNSFSYSIPLASYADHSVAPVKITNSPRWKPVQKELESYLKNPLWTFGGDFDYDRSTIMDSFHNMRVLAWSTWSLDDKERIKRFKELAKPLSSLTPGYYHHEIEPVSKREYWWDEQIFWQAGLVNWDSEWYNGMNLGGPWAYWQYGDGVSTKDDLMHHFKYMDKWLAYIEMTSDWVLHNPCTTIPGAGINLDGSVHAYEGIIAMARVAHVLRKKALENRMKYLASKMQIPWYDSWKSKDYYRYFLDLGAIERRPELEKNLNDWSWVRGYQTDGPSISYRPQESYISHYGIFDPELLEFYREFLLPEIKDYEYRAFPKYFPQWVRATGLNQGRINTGPHMPNSDHANFKDPHFITRSLLFREGFEKIKQYDIEHTGQVLESFMAGAHPMVLFPSGARFGGNVWDEKSQTLITTLIKVIDDKVVVIIDPARYALKKIEGASRQWRVKDRIYVEVRFGRSKHKSIKSYY